MAEEKNKYLSEEDVENLLSPRCDFHVSSGFKDRVTRIAPGATIRKRRQTDMWISSAIAAAASVIIIIVALHYRQAEKPATDNLQPAIAMTDASPDSLRNRQPSQPVDKKIIAKTDDLAKSQKKAGVHSALTLQKSCRKDTPDKVKLPTNDRTASDERITEPEGSEGPMPTASNLNEYTAPDPERIRDLNTELRLRAKTAYIENVRKEIEETHAYIRDIKETRLKQ